MRAGLVPLVLLAAFCGTLTEARAQNKKPVSAAPAELKADNAAPGMHVLVVDVQSLLQKSKSAKMVRDQIEQKRAEYAKEISHQEEQLRKERDTLQRQQASLSPAALKQKGRDFQQKVNDLDRSVQAKRQALEHSNAEALERIQSVMLKIITGIAKDRKANLVFQRSELVLFDQGFDVTDEVLKKLDEQLPTLTVNFVAPKEESPPASETRATSSHSKHRR
jgi:Skp family chaperone for outer membrane proteins